MNITHGALFAGLTLALFGCGSDKDKDSGAVCDTCDCIQHPDVDDMWPASNATDVYNRTQIYAVVDDDTEFASSMTLVEGGGTAVAGTASFDADEGLITFVPDSALLPDTPYTMTLLTNECEGDSFHFTTSSIGAPVADLNTLVGRTWRMSLGDGRPPADRDGLQSVIDMVAEDLLINATAVNGTTLTVVVGSTTSGDNQPQDLCVPTIEVALDMTQNPYAFGDVPNGYAPLSGAAVPTFGGSVSGSFSPDGTVLAGIDLTMILDMDAAGVIMNDDLCALLPTLGVQCETCPASAGNCLTFNTWAVDGGEDTSAVVTVRTQNDVDTDPTCTSR